MLTAPVFGLALAAAAAPAVGTSALLPELKPYAVTLSVGDIEQMARWYADVLDFQVTDRKDYPEFGTRLVFLERGGFRIELIADAQSSPAVDRPDPPAHTRLRGVSQIAFEVPDLAAAEAALRRHHVRFAWTPQRYPDLGVAFLFIRDPEGNLIQLIQKL